MFVAYVHSRSNSGDSFYDVLGVSKDVFALQDLCDREIAHDRPLGETSSRSERWKHSGLTGYYKPVTIGEYSYFYAIAEVEEFVR